MSLENLPYDILQAIYTSIDTQRDRNALLRTCRCFYNLWNEPLYQTAVQLWPAPTAKWTIKHGREDTLQKLLDAGLPLIAVHALGLLFQAISHDKEGIVRVLIRHGADIECSHRDSEMTPLLQCIEFGRDSIAALLLEQGADPNNGGERDWPPLTAAAIYSRTKITALLLEKGARLENTLPLAETLRRRDSGRETLEVLLDRAPRMLLQQTDDHECTLLDRAVEANNAPAATLLLQAGANLYSGGPGSTPLLEAIRRGRTEMISFLLSEGASPNQREDQYSPLAVAIEKRAPGIAQQLIEAGADPECIPSWLGQGKDESQYDVLYWNHTSLVHAVHHGLEDTVSLLLDAGANPNPTVTDGFSPLVVAALYDHGRMAERLLEKGATPDPVAHCTALTPLAWAVRNGNERLARGLLERGVDPNRCYEFGCTPLILSALNGHAQIAKMLLEYGADPYITDEQGRTPLAISAQRGFADVVFALVENGHATDIPDKQKRTPLFYAVLGCHVKVVELLLASGSWPADTATTADRTARSVSTQLLACPALHQREEPHQIWGVLHHQPKIGLDIGQMGDLPKQEIKRIPIKTPHSTRHWADEPRARTRWDLCVHLHMLCGGCGGFVYQYEDRWHAGQANICLECIAGKEPPDASDPLRFCISEAQVDFRPV
ncbi:ankyrin repeat-containing domain protein [Aspergillus pseudodeflectus]|uniref:Ankyrin repeat-containing domain protein n=1 Tax=Aspergillus pseudodeflectus TaxID=176178 RepID=A0ABR4KMV0_9EURO